MGLKKDLHAILKSLNGEVLTYEQFEVVCKRHNNKTSNGERRLRPSDSPEVDTLRNSKGFITGYCWKIKSYPYQTKMGFAQ